MWGGMTVVTTSSVARLKKAKHHEIKVRYGWGKKRPLLTVLRESELNREYSDRYGSLLLPDDDSGRDDIEFMLHHLAPGDDPARRITRWLDLRAPWFTGLQRATMVERVLANPFKFNKDTAAKRIGLTAERRTRLNIRTIAAIDQTAAERKAASRRAKFKLSYPVAAPKASSPVNYTKGNPPQPPSHGLRRVSVAAHGIGVSSGNSIHPPMGFRPVPSPPPRRGTT